MHRLRTLVDDARDVCIHCNKPIHWSKREEKWFHVHNLLTFCTGRASSETEAAPTKKWEDGRPQTC